jgi:hypothetical protein
MSYEQDVPISCEIKGSLSAHGEQSILKRGEISMKRRTVLALPAGALLCMAASGRPALAQQKQGFIVQNNYWALPGKAEEVYQWRIHASDVRERLGLPRGQVLRRQSNSENLPDVIWQMDFLNEADRVNDVKIMEAGGFQEVVKHMTTLTRRFESSRWLLN